MNVKTIIEALHYLSSKLNQPIDTMKALKLIFFADRYHIRKYARFITDDNYVAMRKGTVASRTYDLLKNLDKNDLFYSDEFTSIRKVLKPHKKYEYTITKEKIDYEMLSDTDKEALDFSIKNFGDKERDELSDITHDYPEWKRYESSFEGNLIKVESVKIEDFFDNPDLSECNYIEKDYYDIIDSDIVKLSKDFYFGNTV